LPAGWVGLCNVPVIFLGLLSSHSAGSSWFSLVFSWVSLRIISGYVLYCLGYQGFPTFLFPSPVKPGVCRCGAGVVSEWHVFFWLWLCVMMVVFVNALTGTLAAGPPAKGGGLHESGTLLWGNCWFGVQLYLL